MKVNTLAAASCALIASSAFAGVTGLSMELVTGNSVHPDWAAEGYDVNMMDTYRIYAESDDMSEQIIAVFGNETNALSLNVSSGNVMGGATPNLGPASQFFPASFHWLNYVTIGTDFAEGGAFNTSPGFGGEVGDLAGSFSATNASWFITPPDAPQGTPDANGRILLWQITVSEGALFDGVVNLQATGGVQYTDLTFSNVPAPGALALLGLAGFAGRRRRA